MIEGQRQSGWNIRLPQPKMILSHTQALKQPAACACIIYRGWKPDIQ
jgi:hypothetical protein